MVSLSSLKKTITIAIVIILGIFVISFAYSKASDYFQQMKDQIIQEQVAIQDGLKNQIKVISEQRRIAEEQMVKLRQERDTLKAKYSALEVKNNELKKKLASIVVPTEPDDIVRGFQQLGLRSVHTRAK